MIRGVIFDFGRVISAQKPQSLFRRYERELGLPTGTINSIMFDSPAWRNALLGRMTMEDYWKKIGPALGLHSPGETEQFHRRYHGDERIDTHVLHLLRRLRGYYKLAVCSNSPPGLNRWLADWNIDHYFDVVFCSGDEGIVKPDAAAYELTCERMGITPSEAVFVDDTLENVEAAARCGLRAILFTDGPALEKDLSGLLTLPPARPPGMKDQGS